MAPSGDLFPLPVPVVEASVKGKLSRGCRQKIGQRRAVQNRVADVVRTLNWMSGAKGGSSSTTAVQARVLNSIEAAVLQTSPETVVPAPHEAARALLRSSALYEGTDSDVCPYRKGTVALPDDCSSCPSLIDIAPPHVQEMLRGPQGHMLRSDLEYWETIDNSPKPPTYVDKVLGSNRQEYRGFLKELHRRGLVTFLLHRREDVGLFFVAKKDKRPRMIVDARRSNLHNTQRSIIHYLKT